MVKVFLCSCTYIIFETLKVEDQSGRKYSELDLHFYVFTFAAFCFSIAGIPLMFVSEKITCVFQLV